MPLTRKILRILFVLQDLLLIIFIITLRYVFLNKNKRLLLLLFPICVDCDVIFSYIYGNATKLVLHLSYFVRYCFK